MPSTAAFGCFEKSCFLLVVARARQEDHREKEDKHPVEDLLAEAALLEGRVAQVVREILVALVVGDHVVLEDGVGHEVPEDLADHEPSSIGEVAWLDCNEDHFASLSLPFD